MNGHHEEVLNHDLKIHQFIRTDRLMPGSQLNPALNALHNSIESTKWIAYKLRAIRGAKGEGRRTQFEDISNCSQNYPIIPIPRLPAIKEKTAPNCFQALSRWSSPLYLNCPATSSTIPTKMSRPALTAQVVPCSISTFVGDPRVEVETGDAEGWNCRMESTMHITNGIGMAKNRASILGSRIW